MQVEISHSVDLVTQNNGSLCRKVSEFPNVLLLIYHLTPYHIEIGVKSWVLAVTISPKQMVAKGYDYWALGLYPGVPTKLNEKEHPLSRCNHKDILREESATSVVLA